MTLEWTENWTSGSEGGGRKTGPPYPYLCYEP